MFGFHYLIFNLLSCLAFLSPINGVDTFAIQESSFEVVITTGTHQSPAIIELGTFLNPIIDSSQTNELPVANPFNRALETPAVSYEAKLLYLEIGNSIDLELTTTAIIFPFHCFT